jgi:hypothetical protein
MQLHEKRSPFLLSVKKAIHQESSLYTMKDCEKICKRGKRLALPPKQGQHKSSTHLGQTGFPFLAIFFQISLMPVFWPLHTLVTELKRRRNRKE